MRKSFLTVKQSISAYYSCRTMNFEPEQVVTLLNVSDKSLNLSEPLFPHLCCCLVSKSCLALRYSTDCSLPGFSVHGISQARILEWVAISFSRDPSLYKKKKKFNMYTLSFRIFVRTNKGSRQGII